jgi:hypothetical protein
MINNPFLIEKSRALAKKTDSITNPQQRVQALYKQILARSASANESSRASEFIHSLTTMSEEVPPPPLWTYGYGHLNPENKTFSQFTLLPHFDGKTWQGSAKFPDKTLNYTSLHRTGGHPGNSHEQAVARRFTATLAGRYVIDGELKRPSENGDGVHAYVLVNGKAVADWQLATGAVTTKAEGIQLEVGQTLDFVIDINANNNSDSFTWSVKVACTDKNRVWSSQDEFSGPMKPGESITPWERLAQVLLLSNEFAFTD